MGLERVRAVHARLDAPIALSRRHRRAAPTARARPARCWTSILRCAGYRVGPLHVAAPAALQRARAHRRRDATDAELIAAFDAVEDARVATHGADARRAAHVFRIRHARRAVAVRARAARRAGARSRARAAASTRSTSSTPTWRSSPASASTTSTTSGRRARTSAARRRASSAPAARRSAPIPIRRPASIARARRIGAPLLLIGRDYGYVAEETQWRYWGPARRALRPAVSGAARRLPARQRGDGARGARPAARPPAGERAARCARACSTVELPGRFQVLPGRPTVVLDVAHNPHAARALADALGAMGYHPQTHRGVRHARRQGHRAA